MTAYNLTRGRMVASKVVKADTPWSRAKGLLGHRSLELEEAMWIVPCNMIHTCFMRFGIDVVFLDRDLRVLRVLESIRPWRLSPWVFGGHSVLELAAGASKDSVKQGDQLEMR